MTHTLHRHAPKHKAQQRIAVVVVLRSSSLLSMKPKLAAAASSMRVIGAVFCTFDPTQNKELPLLYAVGAPSLCHCLCGGGLKKTSPLTFQMSDFETQKILMKNKKVYL